MKSTANMRNKNSKYHWLKKNHDWLFILKWTKTGWWYTYPSEKYESQLGWLFPIYGKKCSKPPTRKIQENSIVVIMSYLWPAKMRLQHGKTWMKIKLTDHTLRCHQTWCALLFCRGFPISYGFPMNCLWFSH